MKKVTDEAILAAIDAGWREKWTSPSVRELGAKVGLFSPSTVLARLDSLVDRGVLERKRAAAQRVLYRRR